MKIILVIVLVILFTLPLYGQTPTPTKRSNPPQKQTADKQKQTEPQSNITPNPIKQSTPNSNNGPANTSGQQNDGPPTNRWLIRFSGILAIVAFLQLILAIIQVYWMLSIQRAFVLVDENQIFNVAGDPPSSPYSPYMAQIDSQIGPQIGPWIFQPNVGPRATIVIRNSGRTPAKEVIHWGKICIQEYPLRSNLPPKEPPIQGIVTKITLASNGRSFKEVGIEKPLTPEEIENLKAGTTAIYLYGEISYKLIFGIKRITKYRFMYNGLAGVVGQASIMMGCEEGNEAN